MILDEPSREFSKRSREEWWEQTMDMTAGQAIVEILKAEGVRYVFGMPGGHTIGIYDALYDTPEIKHVLVRHEHAAACMAAGYAQLTG
eukprot:gene64141-87734_t